MSTYAGGRHRPDPDSPTDLRCGWLMCVTPVPHRFWRENVFLCQDHALLAWATVERMNAIGRPPRKRIEPERKIEGSVYYIRIGDRVKIGHSTDIFKRLATYPPTMEVLAIRDGSRDLEHHEHIRFGEHRTDGREWFEANERVLAMITEVAEGTNRDWEQEWFQRRTHQPQTVAHSTRAGQR